MTKQEITENYFKALGWEFGSFSIKSKGSSMAYRYPIKSPYLESEK